MPKADRAAYSPLDFVQWKAANSLSLTPKFQRRGVWNARGGVRERGHDGVPAWNAGREEDDQRVRRIQSSTEQGLVLLKIVQDREPRQRKWSAPHSRSGGRP